MPANEPRRFRPELMPRRGEWTAWILASIVAISLVALRIRLGWIPVAAWFFWALLVFSALSISLGNWVDRRTELRLDKDAVAFENGLRKVRLTWPQIDRVTVIPSRWGRQVQVLGGRAHFEFRTLAEVEYQEQVRGRVGFSDGTQILDEIVRSARLVETEKDGQRMVYSRG